MAAQQNRTVSVDRVIAAAPAAIFAVLSDASRHPEIDGSGQLVKAKDVSTQRLALGSTFGMDMKLGVPYTTKNTVIEFQQDRRIAWQTVVAGPLGRFLGGRIWRYELEPVGDGTKVTETWDITRDRQAFFLQQRKVGQHMASAMSTSLERLARTAGA